MGMARNTAALRNRRIVIPGATLLFFGLGLRAGNPEESNAGFTIRSDVRLVLLDVSVKDRSGGLVSGLSKQDFTVVENGHPQPISVFANDDLPVTVGIVVDESASMRPKRVDVLTAALTFIQESNAHDEIFVLNFNDTVKRGLPDGMLFSDDVAQLKAALYRGVPQGRTALNDAVIAGLNQLERGRRDKKTLVVISDGGDNISEHTRKQMLATVEGSIATVYTIGIYDADDPDRNPGVLRELAKISGGEAYFPESLANLAPVCRRIAKDIRARYTIGYIPPSDNGGTLRHISVKVSAPGHEKLSAHTRTSYRYDEITNQKKK